MNPVYDLLVESLACAGLLATADCDGLLHDTIERAYEVIELRFVFTRRFQGGTA